MKAERVLAAACVHVDCSLDQVLAHHIYEDCITLVVDRGIAGGPKYTVPLADLVEQEPAPLALAFEEITLATPSALRLANKLGIELARVEGSGRGGQILKRDVERYGRTSL